MRRIRAVMEAWGRRGVDPRRGASAWRRGASEVPTPGVV